MMATHPTKFVPMKRCRPNVQTRSHVCILGSVKEWTTHSRVDSHFGSWNPYGVPNLQRSISGGQNSLDYKVPYPIGKLLKRKCPKWARKTHLSTQNTSYGQKEGPGVKVLIWFSNTKSWEWPWFFELLNMLFEQISVGDGKSPNEQNLDFHLPHNYY
jgi:hypothetical protein